MNQLKLKTNYTSNNELREKLYPLFDKVFGIEVDTLEDFYARGFWDPTYTPFTFFNGDVAVSNVSVFEMPLMINGEKRLAAGVQSVMTDPEYRGRGLMNYLMKKAVEYIDSKYDLSLLMTSNPELYRKYGYRVIKEHYFNKKLPRSYQSTDNNLIHLDIFDSNDIQKIRWAFTNNKATSSRFYPTNYAPSFCLNMYNPILHEMVYYSMELDVIIIYEVNDSVLELYDIVGPKIPTLEQIYSVIPKAFNEVNIYFSPDLLGEVDFIPIQYEDVDYLMVRGDFDLEHAPIKLPITAEF